ncbi:MAG: hypothetical protein COA41_12280 [Sphingopyxis sp.]|nr:MAG: hypothetical protein COA41_12280 [Sphingopyxis sp.]
MRDRFNTFLLLISIFAFSLSTFSYRAAFVAYISLTTIFLINSKKRVKIRLSIMIASMIVTGYTVVISYFNYLHIPYLVKMMGMLLYASIFANMYLSEHIKLNNIIKALKYYIYIHSAFFIAQLTLYPIFGEAINFDSYIRESESAIIVYSSALEIIGLPIRATGLFSEPSFYSMSILPFCLLLIAINKKPCLATSVGIITSLLSLSLASILVSSLAGIIFLLFTKRNSFTKVVMILCVVFFSPAVYKFIDARAFQNIDYDAVGSRTLVFDEFALRSNYQNIFGSGFFWDESTPIGVTGLKGYHTRDSSFYVYVFFSAGLIGLAGITIALAYTLRKNLLLLMFTACILLFKFSVLHAALWLFLCLAYISSKRSTPKISNTEFTN